MRLYINLILIFCSIAIFGQEHVKVKAGKGDGIYSLLRKNNLNPSEHFDAFIELNKKKLGNELILKKGKLTFYLQVNR